jgi:hypothetical protein
MRVQREEGDQMSVTAETHIAKVTAVDDPEKRGRIRVACATIMGSEDEELPMWIEPAHVWGWFFVPDVGELVEIEIVAGADDDEQPGQASIDSLDATWRGTRFYGNEDAEEGEGRTPIASDFTATNYGKRRGLCTPTGHVLMFDDTAGKEQVSLTWANAEGLRSFIAFDDDGSCVLNTHSGHLLFLNSKDGELSLIDQHGNTYATNEEGSKLITGDGKTMIDLRGGTVQVSGDSVVVACKTAQLAAGNVKLGDGPAAAITESLIQGVKFMAAFVSHTHPTGMGPSGPPAPNPDFLGSLSQTSSTK